ncbi:MAG: hypothetical protein Q8Q52_05550 [Acidimicrobiia bacterium]|nr:hypothetical protein [Acidimicrobiia bacterium]
MSNRPASPDPVNDPRAYQQHLLGLIGDDDPATVQSSTVALFRQLAVEAAADLRAIPAPGEWSVMGCIAHVADAEVTCTRSGDRRVMTSAFG